MGFFRELLGGHRDRGSSQVAKQRLMMVLVGDRYRLTPDQVDQMKHEMAELLSRYLPNINADQIEVSLLRDDDNERLHAQIPLRRSQQGER